MEKTLIKAIKTICCSLTGVLTISGTPQQVYAEMHPCLIGRIFRLYQ